jgi:hypothetical protein
VVEHHFAAFQGNDTFGGIAAGENGYVFHGCGVEFARKDILRKGIEKRPPALPATVSFFVLLFSSIV